MNLSGFIDLLLEMNLRIDIDRIDKSRIGFFFFVLVVNLCQFHFQVLQGFGRFFFNLFFFWRRSRRIFVDNERLLLGQAGLVAG